MENGQNRIDSIYKEKGLSYASYRQLIDVLLEQGKTTGANQSGALLEFAKLNVARMKRLDKTIVLLPALKEVVLGITIPQTWFVLTEGWCGDAAQIVPVFNAVAELNKNINLQFLLRDENLDLMDEYLTNGISRSIPKLIAVDSDFNELFNWGPRPQPLQEIFYAMRAKEEDYHVIKEALHTWYSKDKTLSTQQELLALLR